MRHRLPLLALLVVVLVGALASSASALPPFTTSHVTTPGDPWFVLNQPTWGNPGNSIDVEGTTNGTGGSAAIVCTYGNGDTAHRLTLAAGVPIGGDGTFSTTAPLSRIALQTCVLRALPSSTSDVSSSFTGPRIGAGQTDNEEDVATPTDATHTSALARGPGVSTDFFTAVSQLGGYMEWQSASSCGLTYSYPYAADFGFSGDGTIADEPLFDCAGALYPVGTGDGRSDIRLDDQSVVTSYGAWTVDVGSDGGTPQIPVGDFPQPTHTTVIDPLTGDTTITENEPLSYCLRSGSPTPVEPSGRRCMDLAPAHAHLTRTIVQSHDGGMATVTDSFVDESGSARALTVTYDQHVGRDATPETGAGATQPTFRFAGDAAYAGRSTGDVVTPAAEAPGTIGIAGDPAGAEGTANPQGAIVYGSAPDSIVFRYANDPAVRPNSGFNGSNQNGDIPADGNAADFEMTYERPLPANGSVQLTHTYVQALTRAAADALAGAASSAYTTPSVAIASPADAAVVTTADITVTGTATDRFTATTLTVNGTAVPVGADGAWSAPLTLAPGTNTITAVATNGAGKTSQAQSTVIYTPATILPLPGGPPAPAPAPACIVPAPLVGARRDAAQQAIVAASCTLGTVRTERSASVKAGFVISASLPSGTVRGNSFPIDLVVSSGPAPTRFTVVKVTSPTATASGDVGVSLVIPGAGKVDVLATYSAPGGHGAHAAVLKPGKHRRTFASKITVLHRAQRLVIQLTPTKTARAVLKRKHKRHQTLTVRVHVGFAPVNGHPSRRLAKTLHLR